MKWFDLDVFVLNDEEEVEDEKVFFCFYVCLLGVVGFEEVIV